MAADEIESFLGTVPVDVASKLDGSVESLNAFEAWLLSQYSNLVPYRAKTSTSKTDRAVRYVGEVFRRHLQGVWDISFDEGHKLGLPVMVGFPGQETALGPHRLVSASIDRRTGEFLATVLRDQLSLRR